MAFRSRRAWICAASFALAGGCGEGKGATAATTDSDTDSDTGATTGSAVRLSTLATYLPLGGAPVERSQEPSGSETQVTVEVGDDVFSGVYDGEAWIVFAGVPEVTYQLHWAYPPTFPGTAGAHTFMETARRDVGAGDVYSGRPDVALTTNSASALAVTASAMSPLGAFDGIELYSYNADAWHIPSPFEGIAAPFEGDTELAGWTVPWADAISNRGAGGPLIDPDQGDDLWLTHLTSRPLVLDPSGDELDDPWSQAQVLTLVEATQLALTPMVDGATTTATGVFAPVPAKDLTVDLRTSAFFAELAATLGPGYAPYCSATVLLEPGVDRPLYGMTPTLGEVAVDGEGFPLLPGDRVLDLPYGNPFPIGTETLQIFCRDVLVVAHPTAFTNETLVADIYASWPVNGLGDAPVAPSIGFVRDIQISGAPLAATDVQSGLGTTPTLTFSPPEVGAPDSYSIQLRTLEDVLDDQGVVVSSRRTVATFYTTSTTVKIPDGILEPGSYYHFIINASFGLELGDGRPYQHNTGGARAASGLFTP